MDRILKILKKENGPRASSAPALELNTITFKHVYWYMLLISGERLQDHWSSGYSKNVVYIGYTLFSYFFIQNIDCGDWLELPLPDFLTCAHNQCFEHKY